MIEVPLHRPAQSRCKSFFRLPAQLAGNPRRIDRVTAIMPGAVFHKSDQLGRRFDIPIWGQFTNGLDQSVHDIKVLHLATSTNHISFSCGPGVHCHRQSAGMIAYIEPVTDVGAISIHR